MKPRELSEIEFIVKGLFLKLFLGHINMPRIEEIIAFIIILIVIVYVGIQFFIAFVTALWQLSPLTSIGFVISVIVAIWSGHISIDKLEDNLKILLFIFAGTVISYAATSMIPTLLNVAFGGELLAAVIMGLIILVIWLRGQEIKNFSP